MTQATEPRSLVAQVYARLRREVTAPGARVGDRLPPLRALAERFGTSMPTVQRAVGQLAGEGVLERRQGAGNFIASPAAPLQLAHSVVLCIEARAHLFGELGGRLLASLHDLHRLTSLIDSSSSQAPAFIRRLLSANAGCFVVHGNLHFPFATLLEPAFNRVPLIGVIDWETELNFPAVHRVLSDYAHGARLVADHLWALGHRRVLLLGTATQVWFIDHGSDHASPLQRAFVREWTARGGTWRALASEPREAGTAALIPEDLLARLDGPEAPTAIFGLRDYEAHLAQRLIRRTRPGLLSQLAIVGYFDTPWASAADPSITAVNLNLPEIARHTIAIVNQVLDQPATPPRTTLVKPSLIIRESSQPRV